MLHNVNPINTNINITQVKNVKDGGLQITCESDSESEKLKEVVTEKLSDKLLLKKYQLCILGLELSEFRRSWKMMS